MPSRPKWPVSLLPDLGAKTLELAHAHRAELEPRLAPGVIDGLGASLRTLRNTHDGTLVVSSALRAATATQDQAAEAGYQLVSGVRRAIVRVGNKTDARAFGVGEALRKDSVPQVLGGLVKFLAAAEARPATARAAGVLPSDLDAARTLRVELEGADAAQATLKAKKPSATVARNAAARDVASHIDAVLAAADLAFYAQPAVLARFHAIVPTRKRAARPAARATP